MNIINICNDYMDCLIPEKRKHMGENVFKELFSKSNEKFRLDTSNLDSFTDRVSFSKSRIT